jgi:hypothetical protein
MRLVKLTCAMKTDSPFLIVGDKDAELRLSHAAAQFVVRGGNGVYIDGGEPKPEFTRAELEQQEEKIQAGNLKQVGEETSQSADEPPEEIKKPYGNAPKSAWVRYACSVDPSMTEERGESMTKADLMSRYGERL